MHNKQCRLYCDDNFATTNNNRPRSVSMKYTPPKDVK